MVMRRARVHDCSMRILVKLMWRMLTRLLRQLGPGALLVPVAAISMVLFGVSVWTLAAVVLALILAFRAPAAASCLLPVTMVGLGVGGLIAAAANPSGPVTAVVLRFIPKPLRASWFPSHPASYLPSSPRPPRQAVWQMAGATRLSRPPQLFLPAKTAFLPAKMAVLPAKTAFPPAGGAGQTYVGAAGPFAHGPGL